MITIKILGCGTVPCQKLLQITQNVIDIMRIDAEIIQLVNYDEITAYPILETPGLVIDEILVSSGRVPNYKEIKGWLSY